MSEGGKRCTNVIFCSCMNRRTEMEEKSVKYCTRWQDHKPLMVEKTNSWQIIKGNNAYMYGSEQTAYDTTSCIITKNRECHFSMATANYLSTAMMVTKEPWYDWQWLDGTFSERHMNQKLEGQHRHYASVYMHVLATWSLTHYQSLPLAHTSHAELNQSINLDSRWNLYLYKPYLLQFMP